MSFCRITGRARGLPKPHYFPIVPAVLAADVRRFCRITGKSYGLPKHHFIPIIVARFSIKKKLNNSQNSQNSQNKCTTDIFTNGKRKHLFVAGYLYLFPVFNEDDNLQKELINLLNTKISPGQYDFVYKVDTQKCCLVFSASLEAAVRDGDICNVMLAQNCDILLLDIGKGESISVNLKQYDGDIKRLLDGQGVRPEQIIENDKEKLKNGRCGLKSKNESNANKKIKKNINKNDDENKHDSTTTINGKIKSGGLSNCLTPFGGGNYDIFGKDNLDTNFNVIDIEEHFIDNTIGFDIATGVDSCKSIISQPDPIIFEHVSKMSTKKLENLNNLNEKIKNSNELFESLPTSSDLVEIFEKFQNGTSDTIAGVPGMAINLDNGKRILITGEYITTPNGKTFVPGYTVDTPQGAVFVPGLAIQNKGETSFIPGNVLPSTENGKNFTFVAGQVKENVFVPGQTCRIGNEMKFIEGITTITSTGFKFQPVEINKKYPSDLLKAITDFMHNDTSESKQIDSNHNNNSSHNQQSNKQLKLQITEIENHFIQNTIGLDIDSCINPTNSLSITNPDPIILQQILKIPPKKLDKLSNLTEKSKKSSELSQSLPTKSDLLEIVQNFQNGQPGTVAGVPGMTITIGDNKKVLICGEYIKTSSGKTFVPGYTVDTPNGPVFVPGLTISNNGETTFVPGHMLPSSNDPTALTFVAGQMKENTFVPGQTCQIGGQTKFMEGLTTITTDGLKFQPIILTETASPKHSSSKIVKQTSKNGITGKEILDVLNTTSSNQCVLQTTEIKEHLIENTIGFEVSSCANTCTSIIPKPDPIVLDQLSKISPKQLEKLSNLTKKAQTSEELSKALPTTNDLLEVLQNIQNGKPTIIASVPGMAVCISNDKKVLICGEYVSTPNGKQFVPGYTVNTPDGPMFVAGLTINNNGDPSFIPGHLLPSPDDNKALTFIAGQMKEDTFIPGQTFHFGNQTKFVEGLTVISSDGIKFQPIVMNEINNNEIGSYNASGKEISKIGENGRTRNQCMLQITEIENHLIDNTIGFDIASCANPSNQSVIVKPDPIVLQQLTKIAPKTLEKLINLVEKARNSAEFFQALPSACELIEVVQHFQDGKPGIVSNVPGMTICLGNNRKILISGEYILTPMGKVFVPGYAVGGPHGPEFVAGLTINNNGEPSFIPGHMLRSSADSKDFTFVAGQMKEDTFIPGQTCHIGNQTKFIEGITIVSADGIKFQPIIVNGINDAAALFNAITEFDDHNLSGKEIVKAVNKRKSAQECKIQIVEIDDNLMEKTIGFDIGGGVTSSKLITSKPDQILLQQLSKIPTKKLEKLIGIPEKTKNSVELFQALPSTNDLLEVLQNFKNGEPIIIATVPGMAVCISNGKKILLCGDYVQTPNGKTFVPGYAVDTPQGPVFVAGLTINNNGEPAFVPGHVLQSPSEPNALTFVAGQMKDDIFVPGQTCHIGNHVKFVEGLTEVFADGIKFQPVVVSEVNNNVSNGLDYDSSGKEILTNNSNSLGRRSSRDSRLHIVELDHHLTENTSGFDIAPCITSNASTITKPNPVILEKIAKITTKNLQKLIDIPEKVKDSAELSRALPTQSDLLEIVSNYQNGKPGVVSNVPGMTITLGNDKTILLCGEYITTPNGKTFVPGYTVDGPEGPVFVAGLAIKNNNGETTFIPGHMVPSSEDSSSFTFVAGQTKDNTFIPGQVCHIGNETKFVEGATVISADGLKFQPLIVNEVSNGMKGIHKHASFRRRSMAICDKAALFNGELTSFNEDEADDEFNSEQLLLRRNTLNVELDGPASEQCTLFNIVDIMASKELGAMLSGETLSNLLNTLENKTGENKVHSGKRRRSSILEKIIKPDEDDLIANQARRSRRKSSLSLAKVQKSDFVPGQGLETINDLEPGQLVYTKVDTENGEQLITGQVINTKDGPGFVPGRIYESDGKLIFLPGQVVQTPQGPKSIAFDLTYNEQGKQYFSLDGFPIVQDELGEPIDVSGYKEVKPDSVVLEQLSKVDVFFEQQMEVPAVTSSVLYTIKNCQAVKKNLQKLQTEAQYNKNLMQFFENFENTINMFFKNVNIKLPLIQAKELNNTLAVFEPKTMSRDAFESIMWDLIMSSLYEAVITNKVNTQNSVIKSTNQLCKFISDTIDQIGVNTEKQIQKFLSSSRMIQNENKNTIVIKQDFSTLEILNHLFGKDICFFGDLAITINSMINDPDLSAAFLKIVQEDPNIVYSIVNNFSEFMNKTLNIKDNLDIILKKSIINSVKDLAETEIKSVNKNELKIILKESLSLSKALGIEKISSVITSILLGQKSLDYIFNDPELIDLGKRILVMRKLLKNNPKLRNSFKLLKDNPYDSRNNFNVRQLIRQSGIVTIVPEENLVTSKEVPVSMLCSNNQLAIEDFLLRKQPKTKGGVLVIAKERFQAVVPREASKDVLMGKCAYSILDETGIQHFEPHTYYSFPDYSSDKSPHIEHATEPLGSKSTGSTLKPRTTSYKSETPPKSEYKRTTEYQRLPDYHGLSEYQRHPDYHLEISDHHRQPDYGIPDYQRLSDYHRVPEYHGISEYQRLPEYHRIPDYHSKTEYVRPTEHYRVPEYHGVSDYHNLSDYHGLSDTHRIPEYNGYSEYHRLPEYHRQPEYSSIPKYQNLPDYSRTSDYLREPESNSLMDRIRIRAALSGASSKRNRNYP